MRGKWGWWEEDEGARYLRFEHERMWCWAWHKWCSQMDGIFCLGLPAKNTCSSMTSDTTTAAQDLICRKTLNLMALMPSPHKAFAIQCVWLCGYQKQSKGSGQSTFRGKP
jgi:hypothetical protein